jgi:hypothetical protein
MAVAPAAEIMRSSEFDFRNYCVFLIRLDGPAFFERGARNDAGPRRREPHSIWLLLMSGGIGLGP